MVEQPQRPILWLGVRVDISEATVSRVLFGMDYVGLAMTIEFDYCMNIV